MPYAWVPEWHKTDHGLHLHFALGRYVPRSLIKAAWDLPGAGFVHISCSDVSLNSGRVGEARRAARYLGKYVGKGVGEERTKYLKRYDVAEELPAAFHPVLGSFGGCGCGLCLS